MECSVRVELKLLDSRSICNFSMTSVFAITPSKGDFIVIDLPERLILRINSICHFIDDIPMAVIVTEGVECRSYDELLQYLDWFKAKFEITDIKSDEQPQSYYVYYRILLKLLGLEREPYPSLAMSSDDIKSFAAFCRSIILVAMSNKKKAVNSADSVDIIDASEPIEQLHNMIIDMKPKYVESIPIIDIIKKWEPHFNRGYYTWDVDIEECKLWMEKIRLRIKTLKDNSSK